MKNLIVIVVLCLFKLSFSQEVNQFDSNGKRHGEWVKYFDGTKKIRYQGQFVHGKEVGVFKFFHRDAKGKHPSLIKEFSSKTDIASVKYYTSKGKLVQEGSMKGKIRIGEWKFYDKKSNNITEVEHYKNGKLEGEKITYYADGKILQKQFYKLGVLNGKHQLFAENGQMVKDLNYLDGKLNGKFYHYNFDGSLKMEGKYYKSRPVGVWKYYENGKVIKKKDYSAEKVNSNKSKKG